jgi:hypothetical protein
MSQVRPLVKLLEAVPVFAHWGGAKGLEMAEDWCKHRVDAAVASSNWSSPKVSFFTIAQSISRLGCLEADQRLQDRSPRRYSWSGVEFNAGIRVWPPTGFSGSKNVPCSILANWKTTVPGCLESVTSMHLPRDIETNRSNASRGRRPPISGWSGQSWTGYSVTALARSPSRREVDRAAQKRLIVEVFGERFPIQPTDCNFAFF